MLDLKDERLAMQNVMMIRTFLHVAQKKGFACILEVETILILFWSVRTPLPCLGTKVW